MLTRFLSRARRFPPSRPSLLAPLLIFAWLVAVPSQAAQVTYYHPDGLGSAVMESNEAGQVTYSREYRPYGEQVVGAAKDGPGFTGHVADVETGMTYMQQRYYDPTLGRFLSVDPVAAREKGDNFNRYAYAFNNPYRFTDPDGRDGNETIGQQMAWAEPGHADSMQAGSQSLAAGMLTLAAKGLEAADQVMMAMGPVSGGLGKLTAAPLAKVAGAAAKVVSIEARAAKLATRAGSNSVTIKTVKGQVRVDLQGAAHHSKASQTSVPTPHTQAYANRIIPSGPRAGEVGSITKSGDVQAATAADLRIVEKVLDKR